MVVDILQGIDQVDLETVAAVEIAEIVFASVVEVGVEVDAETVFATAVVVDAVNVDIVEADIVIVGVHYVGEGYNDGVDSAAVTEVAQIGVVGYADAALAQIHNVHALVEMRVELWIEDGVDKYVVDSGIDTSVAEAGFETLT